MPVLLAAAIGSLLSGCGERLTEYRDDEGRFRILLPGTPSPLNEKVLGKGARAVQLKQPSGEYTVAWSDPEPGKAGAEEQLDRHCNLAVENLKGKALSHKTISLAGQPGRELLVEAGDGQVLVRLRLYLVDGRLYQVAVGGAKWWVEKPSTAKVLDSFEVLGE
jgi:hypothetical protein